MVTLSFLNLKGGVGKSTTSLNIAAGLADQGKAVLFIDYDKQGNTSSNFKTSPEVTIGDVMLGLITIKDAIFKVEDNLSVISSGMDLKQAEIDLQRDVNGGRFDILREALNTIKDRFDYCVIDCMPDINILIINAIFASDVLIIPIKPEKYAWQGFENTLQSIDSIRNSFSLPIECYVLFTIVNRVSDERKWIKSIRDKLKDNAFEAEIRNQPAPIIRSSNNDKMVIRERLTPIAWDMREVVKEILRRFPNAKDI